MGTFGEWKKAFEAEVAGDQERLAQLANLVEENRIPDVMAAFKDKIVDEFTRLTDAGAPVRQAAVQAFDTIKKQTAALDSPWFRKLPPTRRD